MSNLNSLLSKAKSTKKTLWQRLYEQLDEIEQAKKSGKTYKEIAEEFNVSEAAFSRALKQAKEVKAEIEIEKDEVESTQIQKQDFELVGDEVEKFASLVDELKSIEKNLIGSTNEAVAAAAVEINALTLKTAQIEADVKKYALSSKHYVDKMTAQAMSNIVKKTTDAIDKKLEEADAEINKHKSRFKPSRWTFAAVISCIVLCTGSYYAGTQNHASRVDYNAAKADQKKWSEFVSKWQIATESEKAVVDSMMSRGK